jgi:hypothetical protein
MQAVIRLALMRQAVMRFWMLPNLRRTAGRMAPVIRDKLRGMPIGFLALP